MQKLYWYCHYTHSAAATALKTMQLHAPLVQAWIVILEQPHVNANDNLQMHQPGMHQHVCQLLQACLLHHC